MGGLITSLFAWVLQLVGQKTKAEAQREKARKRKLIKAQRAALKAAAVKKKAEARRKADWDFLLAKHQARAEEREAELTKNLRGGQVVSLDDNPYKEEK